MPKVLVPVLETVTCTLEGYEGVTATYNVNVRNDLLEKAQKEKNAKQYAALLRLKVENWDFEQEKVDDDGNPVLDEAGNPVLEPVPAPSIENGLETASSLFLAWLVGEGYQKAIEQAARPKNSKTR